MPTPSANLQIYSSEILSLAAGMESAAASGNNVELIVTCAAIQNRCKKIVETVKDMESAKSSLSKQ